MSDNTFAETVIRQANPRPTGTTGPDIEWSTTELLSQIEHRSETMETNVRDTGTRGPTGPKRRPQWLMAAAAFAVVVVIGAIAFAVVANRSDPDVVAPTPTTLTAPTTIPATTAPSPTTVPASTVPASSAPPPTTAAVVFEAQTHEATVTWDGETCEVQGPSAVRAGDTLSMTFANNTQLFAKVDVAYLTAGATVGDVRDHFGTSFVQETGPRPSFLVSVDQFGSLESNDGIFSGLVLFPGVVDTQDVLLKTPREHVFICSDNDTQQWDEEWRIGVADPGLTVVDADQPLPELPPQAYDASMTWDGETCTYQGPTAVRAGDKLNMTFTNDSGLLSGFDVGYLTGDAQRQDLVDYLGGTFNLTNYIAPSFAISFHPFSEDGGSFGAGPLLDRGQLLQAGRSVVNEIVIELPRRHIFVCNGGPADATAEFADVPVDVADATMTVTE